MPLNNDKEKYWVGWLVDDLGGREKEYADKLFEKVEARMIPKSTAKRGILNMWWRKDSLYIDVTSSMDGAITSTIHVQEYGTSLFVGRAAQSYSQTNYYKRMGAAAFLETIDRCIVETFQPMVAESAVRKIGDPFTPGV